jgi:hypothetical protein
MREALAEREQWINTVRHRWFSLINWWKEGPGDGISKKPIKLLENDVKCQENA